MNRLRPHASCESKQPDYVSMNRLHVSIDK